MFDKIFFGTMFAMTIYVTVVTAHSMIHLNDILARILQ
jgi:hypothetical protein